MSTKFVRYSMKCKECNTPIIKLCSCCQYEIFKDLINVKGIRNRETTKVIQDLKKKNEKLATEIAKYKFEISVGNKTKR